MDDTAVVEPRVGLDAVVERYVQLRDRKSEIKSEYEKKIRDIDDALDKVEAYLLAHLTAQGAESVKTKAGTFYKQKRTSVTVADWDAYFPWLKENGHWAMLEHRANKTAVEEFIAATQDVPPGLNIRAEYVVNIRRS